MLQLKKLYKKEIKNYQKNPILIILKEKIEQKPLKGNFNKIKNNTNNIYICS